MKHQYINKYIHIYIYIHIHVYIYIYVYIYIFPRLAKMGFLLAFYGINHDGRPQQNLTSQMFSLAKVAPM